MINQVGIARMLKLDVSTVNKILNRKPGTKFSPETIAKVHAAARKHGFDFARLKFCHRRRHERRETDLSARVTLKFQDGTTYDEGRSRVRNISEGGARLSGLEFARGSLPARPFEMLVDVGGISVKAVPVRLIADVSTMDLGVAFTNVDEATRRRLVRLFS